MSDKHKGAILCRKYDAYHIDGEWIEKKCSDPDCEFCHNRPDKPTCKENSND